MPLPSTQKSIDIAGIKDGVVILKNGEYRMILSVSSINFALKSEEEKNAIIFQFQSFLNSLHFPIEIVVRSKRVELAPYLEKMKTIADKQSNELLRGQTLEYIDFVGRLIEAANIMQKAFYVVVSQNAVVANKASFIDNLLGKKEAMMKIAEEEYKRNAEQLKEKARIVASGLSSVGLRVEALTTEQVITFFYQAYNPDLADKQRLRDIEKSLLGSEEQTDPVLSPNEERVENSSQQQPIAPPAPQNFPAARPITQSAQDNFQTPLPQGAPQPPVQNNFQGQMMQNMPQDRQQTNQAQPQPFVQPEPEKNTTVGIAPQNLQDVHIGQSFWQNGPPPNQSNQAAATVDQEKTDSQSGDNQTQININNQ